MRWYLKLTFGTMKSGRFYAYCAQHGPEQAQYRMGLDTLIEVHERDLPRGTKCNASGCFASSHK